MGNYREIKKQTKKKHEGVPEVTVLLWVLICSYWLLGKEMTVKGQAQFANKNKESYLKCYKYFYLKHIKFYLFTNLFTGRQRVKKIPLYGFILLGALSRHKPLVLHLPPLPSPDIARGNLKGLYHLRRFSCCNLWDPICMEL